MPTPNTRIAVGLMSGTSADGIDAVACRIRGRGEAMRATVITHVHEPYSPHVRSEVLAVANGSPRSAEQFLQLDVTLGRLNARAVQRCLTEAGLSSGDLALIAMHGQTIAHCPPTREKKVPNGTWQIGQPAIIAAEFDVPVVSRFRDADMAAGGQGAPLVPWTDYVLLRNSKTGRAVQNIGGIANVTFLPAACNADDVRAFDTGPGNMIIDGLISRFSNGKMLYDDGGKTAAKGRVIEPLLKEWLRHPYFKQRPPKSCGREQFGEEFWKDGISRYRRSHAQADFIATATSLTARSIANAYQQFLSQAVDELIVCGGGFYNRTLMAMLQSELPRTRIRAIEEFNIPAQAKEPLSFALLGCACLDKIPANLPRVTGAKRRVILGQITPAL